MDEKRSQTASTDNCEPTRDELALHAGLTILPSDPVESPREKVRNSARSSSSTITYCGDTMSEGFAIALGILETGADQPAMDAESWMQPAPRKTDQ
jgi:hypothetical protein